MKKPFRNVLLVFIFLQILFIGAEGCHSADTYTKIIDNADVRVECEYIIDCEMVAEEAELLKRFLFTRGIDIYDLKAVVIVENDLGENEYGNKMGGEYDRDNNIARVGSSRTAVSKEAFRNAARHELCHSYLDAETNDAARYFELEYTAVIVEVLFSKTLRKYFEKKIRQYQKKDIESTNEILELFEEIMYTYNYDSSVSELYNKQNEMFYVFSYLHYHRTNGEVFDYVWKTGKFPRRR